MLCIALYPNLRYRCPRLFNSTQNSIWPGLIANAPATCGITYYVSSVLTSRYSLNTFLFQVFVITLPSKLDNTQNTPIDLLCASTKFLLKCCIFSEALCDKPMQNGSISSLSTLTLVFMQFPIQLFFTTHI